MGEAWMSEAAWGKRSNAADRALHATPRCSRTYCYVHNSEEHEQEADGTAGPAV